MRKRTENKSPHKNLKYVPLEEMFWKRSIARCKEVRAWSKDTNDIIKCLGYFFIQKEEE